MMELRDAVGAAVGFTALVCLVMGGGLLAVYILSLNVLWGVLAFLLWIFLNTLVWVLMVEAA